MSTATQTRTPITSAAVGYRLSDISETAEAIRQLALDAQQSVGLDGSPGQLSALIQACYGMATNIGILADMTLADVGSTPTLGDAAAWLLPPVERQHAAAGK